jgi:bis(5'-nucleosyl)-tetraphosphatase (symmetrical)
LNKLQFSGRDRLWLLGDLINRGPDSLGVLRIVRDLHDQCEIILGNHDLHFLAIYFGGHNAGSADTFDDLLAAPDVDELAHWLRRQKLLHYDKESKTTMVHAGIPPQWSLRQALRLAGEVEAVIGGDKPVNGIGYVEYFTQMYGNKPALWSSSLTGMDRLRVVTNYLTRMRMIDASGSLDFAHKGSLLDVPADLIAWYDLTSAKLKTGRLLFGHWAAIDGVTGYDNVIALDTGCVWGRKLTALCLETGELFHQEAL